MVEIRDTATSRPYDIVEQLACRIAVGYPSNVATGCPVIATIPSGHYYGVWIRLYGGPNGTGCMEAEGARWPGILVTNGRRYRVTLYGTNCS